MADYQYQNKPGFISPQQGVPVKLAANQRNQGGASGGGALNNNNVAGNTRVIKNSSPKSSRINASTEDPVSLSNPLESASKAVYNLPKTIGSGVIGAAKAVGRKAVDLGVGVANAISSDGSMRSTPKYSTDQVYNKIGSIVDSALTPSNYSGVIKGALGQINMPQSQPKESINTSSPSLNSNLAQEQFKAGLHSSPIRSDFNSVVDNANYTPESSAFNVDPNNYGTSSGKGGNFMYTKNQDGSISKVDLTGGTRRTLGDNLSHSVDRPLRPEEQAAVDRSNKMIQDWKEYKERKPLQDFINNNLGNPRASAHQMQMAESRLNALDKDKTDQSQVEAYKLNNLTSAQVKQSIADQANRTKLGDQAINYAKAREDATANTFKWLTEAKDKDMTNPYSLTKLAKSRGNLTPEVFHYIHGDSLEDVTTLEEYDQWAADNKIPTEDALIGRQLYQ